MGHNDKNNIYEGHEISCVSDILKITNIHDDNPVLESILEKDKSIPVGQSESGVPRPFSHGVWFRGNQDIREPVIPSAYKLYDRNGNEAFDEKNAFQDLKLRMTTLDTKRYNSFELHCMMRHHGLPSRLLDWSENPLIALYFAVSNINPQDHLTDADGVLTCLNAYRLNELSSVTDAKNPGMFFPDSANILIRSLMSEHTKIVDVVDRMKRILMSNDTQYNKSVIDFSDLLITITAQVLRKDKKKARVTDEEREKIYDLFDKMRYPAAVVPKRNNLRMAAQSSNFTVHGGKLFGQTFWNILEKEKKRKSSDYYLMKNVINKLTDDSEMFSPISLDKLNLMEKNRKFLLHFRIPKDRREPIKAELERLSINNATLFPEFDHQAKFVRTRWIKRIPKNSMNG